MGSSYNQEYVSATQYQADKNFDIATSSNDADIEIAKLQSDAVIAQAKYDYDARIFEATENSKIQMEALRVREKEAELTYKVDWKSAQNDTIRAEASMETAMAKTIEAETESKEADYEHENDMQKLESADDYWYG